MTFSERWQLHKPAVASAGGVVAAQHWQAAQAGASLLAAGGNAVDAAVATAFAVGVVEPWMSGLGGSGYMVIYNAATSHCQAINFQGVVPARIDLAAYPLDPTLPASLMGFPAVVDNRNTVGYGAIAVPGAVAGLALALAHGGTFGFDRVLTPAIDLAERGLTVDWHTTLNIAVQMADLRRDPGASAVFLPDGCPPQPETVLPLPQLAWTLRRLAEYGPNEFYRGAVAERMVDDLRRGGSVLDMDDLAAYRAELVSPLSGLHRGVRVYGADSTSGAQRLLDALRFIEAELTPDGSIGAETYLCYARALDRAFAAHKQRQGALETGCTTHLSVVDRAGNLVALTYTLLNRFGAQVVLPQTGITMNNSLGYFDPRPGRPTSLSGGKRINSSNMCPTIAIGPERCFAVGASGANYIVPAVTQLTALLIDYELSLEDAFHRPRIDASDRGSLRVDPALPTQTLAALGQHYALEVAQRGVLPKLYACPSGVLHDRVSGINYGMSDPSAPTAAAWAAV